MIRMTADNEAPRNRAAGGRETYPPRRDAIFSSRPANRQSPIAGMIMKEAADEHSRTAAGDVVEWCVGCR